MNKTNEQVQMSKLDYSEYSDIARTRSATKLIEQSINLLNAAVTELSMTRYDDDKEIVNLGYDVRKLLYAYMDKVEKAHLAIKKELVARKYLE